MGYSSKRHRWLAIATGAGATCAALFILLKDDVLSGHWSDSFVLVPAVMGIAIAAGHLAVVALWDRKVLSATAFALAFTIATGLVVYQSAGKQAENKDTAVLQATLSDQLRHSKEAELSAARTRYEKAQANADSTRDPVCSKACQGWESRARDVKTQITILENELKSARPARVADPRVAWWSNAIHTLTGADTDRVKALQDLIIPLALTSLFELTAIAAFGFGFSPVRRVPVQPANDEAGPEVPVGPGSGTTVKRDPVIIDWVERFERKNGRPPMLTEVQAAFPNLPKTTAHRYAKVYRAA